MAVNYAEKYSQIVDERFKIGALTSALVNYAYDWVGVSTVKVFSVPTATMGDYKTEASHSQSTRRVKMTQWEQWLRLLR